MIPAKYTFMLTSLSTPELISDLRTLTDCEREQIQKQLYSYDKMVAKGISSDKLQSYWKVINHRMHLYQFTDELLLRHQTYDWRNAISKMEMLMMLDKMDREKGTSYRKRFEEILAQN